MTVWYLPPPRPGLVMSTALTRRLAANYTHPGAPVLNLAATPPPATPRTAATSMTATPMTAAADGGGLVALIIATWPTGDVTAEAHAHACAARLAPEGCLAVVLASHDIPDQLGVLVGAARAAGLTYLQHIVAAHDLRPRPATSTTGQAPATGHAASPDTAPALSRTRRGRHLAHRAHGHASRRRHLRVHTDVLIFRKGLPAADD
jgi:hypothetical protein